MLRLQVHPNHYQTNRWSRTGDIGRYPWWVPRGSTGALDYMRITRRLSTNTLRMDSRTERYAHCSSPVASRELASKILGLVRRQPVVSFRAFDTRQKLLTLIRCFCRVRFSRPACNGKLTTTVTATEPLPRCLDRSKSLV